jgi:hypothetical protein
MPAALLLLSASAPAPAAASNAHMLVRVPVFFFYVVTDDFKYCNEIILGCCNKCFLLYCTTI